MSGQHTPGPWDMRDDDKRITIGCGLVEGPNGYDVAEVYDDDCPHELAQANARLIAAAPELFDALIAAREALASAVIEASGGMFDADTVCEHLVIAQIDAALTLAGVKA